MKSSIPHSLINPVLPITITVIGAGATGSLFITHLARIAYSLYEVYGKRLAVTVIDGDKIETHNVGRQCFYDNEIGQYKAEIVTSRVNRVYGTDWTAVNTHFEYTSKDNALELSKMYSSNFIITCTDNVKSRVQVNNFIKKVYPKEILEWRPYFWIDLGNGKHTGNMIVGSPEMKWPSVIDLYGSEMKKVKEQKGGCSLALSLNEQDLFINPFVASIGAKWLWECLTSENINWRGAFVNLDTFTMQKIKL